MKTPAVVLKEARKDFDKNVKMRHLGEYEGGQAFTPILQKNSTLGFPFVYIYKDGKVDTIWGMESLDVISELTIEDFEE